MAPILWEYTVHRPTHTIQDNSFLRDKFYTQENIYLSL